jgi:hypothetical protein
VAMNVSTGSISEGSQLSISVLRAASVAYEWLKAPYFPKAPPQVVDKGQASR